jgi:deoxyribodipyrimidine photo-lyase
VSPRRLLHQALAIGGEGASTYVSELLWRDFYAQILFHRPDTTHACFQHQWDNLVWQDDSENVSAWMEGRTGYPIVDAAMRQLNTTGWMHNRLRMIVASFLTKDLLIDWRIGEAYFRSHLLDGDLASNVGGWQWAASTGTDAQPWFRVFNPVSQGAKFDPDGAFVRKWLPELKNVPDKFIHAPWLMSYSEASWTDLKLGHDYPKPIVDHGVQRLKALEMFKKVTLTREPS